MASPQLQLSLKNEFHLGILPERQIDRRALGVSYALMVLAIFFLANMGLMFPDSLYLHSYHVTELIPMPSLRPEAPPPVVKPLKMPKFVAPPVIEQPKLVLAPREVHITPKPEVVEAPKVVVNTFAAPQIKLAAATAQPKLLHTGDFGSTATPTVVAAVQKVQTGGFGDPNGLTGQGKQGAKLYAAQAGGFDMPVGAGQGNGSGGSKGIKGTVSSADFGSGIATGPKGANGSVSTGGFGSEQMVHSGPKLAQADGGPATTAVEILSKPQPLYTQEARDLKLEGEVLLEVLFAADGSLHVNRVVRGLGHGLDESAISAANKMHFKPALRMGQPVDSTAVVHVMFQMAY